MIESSNNGLDEVNASHVGAESGGIVEQYSQFTETPKGVVAAVLAAAEHAYQIVGSNNSIKPDEVYLTNTCIEVVDEIGKELCDGKTGFLGAPVDVTYEFVPHRYISLIPPSSDRRIIADPSWQQFLEESQRTPDKPKVLLGTPSEVGKQLRSYGFTDEQVRPWSGTDNARLRG